MKKESLREIFKHVMRLYPHSICADCYQTGNPQTADLDKLLIVEPVPCCRCGQTTTRVVRYRGEPDELLRCMNDHPEAGMKRALTQ